MPVPGPGQVLVRVGAASVNPVDWHIYRGDPWVLRLKTRSKAGEPRGVGEDFAGIITEIGPGVSEYRVGERVFGTIPAAVQVAGAIADFVVAQPQWIARLPHSVPDQDGAAVALAGLTALQALRDAGAMRPGHRVLVWGGSGGVGHLAVQIAHLMGAGAVEAVCSSRNVDMMEELGADAVFDYTRGETPIGPYDLVIDTVCTASARTLRSMLRPGGTVVTIGALSGGRLLGPGGPIIRRALGAKVRGFKAKTIMTRVNHADLATLAEWMATGKLGVRIERDFPLAAAQDAYAVLEQGKVRGKLALVARVPKTGG
ncbi:NAD(P)-dependent alcohol dehydrogenase [Rarobacter incanus]|nr:NAD(P)-dependent alcohol dehydrogenase [Rarobacter incanus]